LTRSYFGFISQVEIEDMDWNEELQAFTYQCPCGDLFQVTLAELAAGECTVPLSSSRASALIELRPPHPASSFLFQAKK